MTKIQDSSSTGMSKLSTDTSPTVGLTTNTMFLQLTHLQLTHLCCIFSSFLLFLYFYMFFFYNNYMQVNPMVAYSASKTVIPSEDNFHCR
jgi:hypothetical protein